MKEILEKILTDKTARDPDEVEKFAAIEHEFSSWNG